MGAVDP